MASGQTQLEALQQQKQNNDMLEALPAPQKAQIEQAVNNYRQQLQAQGFTGEVVQTYVWSYYSTCVQTLYQEVTKGGAASDLTQLQQGQPTAAVVQDQQTPQTQLPVVEESTESPQPSQAPDSSWQQPASGVVPKAAQQQQARLQFQQRQQFLAQQQQMQQQLQQQQFQQQMLGQQANAPKSGGMKTVGMRPSMMGGTESGGKGGGGMWGSSMGGCGGASQQEESQQNDGWGSSAAGDDGTSGTPGPSQAPGLRPQWRPAPKANANQGWNNNQGWNDKGWKNNNNQGGWNDNSANSGQGWNSNDWKSNDNSQGWKSNDDNATDTTASVASTPKMMAPPWKPQQRPQGPGGAMGQNQGANGVRGPVAFSLGARPPVMGMPMGRPPQAQWGQNATQMGQSAPGVFPAKAGMQAAWRPGQATGSRGPLRPGMVGNAAGKGGGGTPQFPPALQRWLQKLFAHQAAGGDADPGLQKQTHVYLRHWVQQWVKSGELWQRNWEVAALPTPDEIRANLAPGILSGQAFSGCSGAAGLGAVPKVVQPPHRPFGAPGAPRATFSGSGFWKTAEGNASKGWGAQSWDNKKKEKSKSRSRSGGRRRSRSNRRRRGRSASSSRSRSRGGRKRSRSSDDSDDGKKGKGATKGKKGGGVMRGPGGKPLSLAEQQEKVKTWMNERLANSGDCRGRHKEIQEELQRSISVNPKHFRSLFNQTVAQYVVAFHIGGPAGPEALWKGPGAAKVEIAGMKNTHQEQDMRAQRAQRFQNHLEVERKSVAYVSFQDGDGGGLDGGPIIGQLDDMCSRSEAKEREMTRQLDKLEWKQGTDPKHPEVNLALATKKYQRSSADKAYRSQDVRTLAAIWKTMEYLMKEILDFDKNPKPGYAVKVVPYIEVYSYCRDRTRGMRVDLHLQQPRSTTQRCFAETHECCLRFEMLSLFLLRGGQGGSTEKYDEKMGLKAISQTIEPLLNAYQAVRDKQLAKRILAEAMGDFGLDDGDDDKDWNSPFEMAIHRYIILLLMSFSPDTLLTHLAKLDRGILSHPLVSFATQVFAAWKTDDYGKFLRCYRNADFLTAVTMSGIVDLARLRALWLLFRTYPQPIGDKVPLARIQGFLSFASDTHARDFLKHHGVQVVQDPKAAGGAVVVLPKKGTPEHAAHPLLAGPNKLPEKCEFPKGADSMLEAKFAALGIGRADIVFGVADPVVEVVEEVEEVIEQAPIPMDDADSSSAPAASSETAVVEPTSAPAPEADTSGQVADAPAAGPTEPAAPVKEVETAAGAAEKPKEAASDAAQNVAAPLLVA